MVGPKSLVAPDGEVPLGERREIAVGAVETRGWPRWSAAQAALMVVGVAAVDLEIGAELLVDARGIVFEEGARLRSPGVVAHRPGAGEDPGVFGGTQGFIARIFAATGSNRLFGMMLPGIGSRVQVPSRELARGRRVVERHADSAEGEVAVAARRASASGW